jgi:hypothetical protein
MLFIRRIANNKPGQDEEYNYGFRAKVGEVGDLKPGKISDVREEDEQSGAEPQGVEIE